MAINDHQPDMLILQDSSFNNMDKGMLEKDTIRKKFQAAVLLSVAFLMDGMPDDHKEVERMC